MLRKNQIYRNIHFFPKQSVYFHCIKLTKEAKICILDYAWRKNKDDNIHKKVTQELRLINEHSKHKLHEIIYV